MVEEGRRLLPVELKTANSVGYGDARHLRSFLAAHDAATRGVLLSSDDAIRELDGGIVAAPWWAVL